MRFFSDNVPLIAFIANLVPLLHFHFAKVFREPGREIPTYLYVLLGIGYFSIVVFFFIDFSRQARIHYLDIVAATTVYATILFVALGEMLIRGGAAYLTKWRGEHWAKELDYVYLTLGAIGLAMSTNRLDVVDQRVSVPEYLGPFLLATALVVRALKTRVEINEWNKPPKPREA